MKKLWTTYEIKFIKDNLGLYSNQELANILKRTLRSVENKLHKMNFIRTNEQQVYFRGRNSKNATEEKNPNWKNGISTNNYHYKKLQKERYPERIKARELVQSALRNGSLIRKPCEICNDIKSHAHHDDYSKPLDVHWLCRRHHREVHDNKY